jgi:hypothetical protein
MLDEIIAEYTPEYFIVTNIPQLEQQAELKKTLDSEYPVLAESIIPGREHAPLDCDDTRYVIPRVPGGESPDYIIYDLRRKNADAPGKAE